MSKKDQQENCDEVCCPLPFPLQDLCLLAIMSNLDSYQVDLLASLPIQLRQRLLSILPDLYLHRLEHTSVAARVDVNEIWKSRSAPKPSAPKSSSRLGHKSRSSFQLNIHSKSYPAQNDSNSAILKEAFGDIDQSQSPQGKEIIFSVASDILAESKVKKPERGLAQLVAQKKTESNLGRAIGKLISIEGGLVFSNLLSGSMHQPCKTSLCGQRVWKKQATALAIQHTPQANATDSSLYNLYAYGCHNDPPATEKVHLIPRYRCSTLNEHDDPLKLLSFLARECSLQPSSAFVDIDFIYNLLFCESLALDSSSNFLSDELSWTSTLNRILSKVIILKLQCNDYSNFSVMTGLVEAAIGYSQLKYLFCSMSNLYLDVVQPFWTLFSLQNFHQLTLELDKLSPLMLCKLLHVFMTAKCSHVQKLIIDVKHDLVLPTSPQPNQLGLLYKGERLPFPSCSAQYKVLQLSPQTRFTHAINLLLRLPFIRLKEMTLVDRDCLHLCTLHPDLQTTKLVIDMPSLRSSTIGADLISLLGMTSLQKISISGRWGHLDEVKLAIVQGLRARSRTCSLPLKKIALELTSSDHYKMIDFQTLCEALFSLPKLENLKLILGKGFADIIQQPRYEQIVYNSWVKRSSRVQLKSICLQTFKTELKQVSQITQKLSFHMKARVRQEYDYSDDLWFGSYHSLYDYGDEYDYGGYGSDDY